MQAIQRAGNWGNNSRNLRYHTKWDIDAVAALADYEGPTRFFCARAEVGPCSRPAARPVILLLHQGLSLVAELQPSLQA